MGINDEYSRDAYDYQLAYDSDSSDEFESPPLHPEDWEVWYSEQLLDAWMTIREYADNNYLELPVTYNNFVDFVMNSNIYYTEEPPARLTLMMWEAIRNIQVIRENVVLQNFTGWSNEFLYTLINND
jgi:hypothetical protein